MCVCVCHSPSLSLAHSGDRNVVDLMLTGVNNPNENGTCHYLNMDDFTSTLDQVKHCNLVVAVFRSSGGI